MAQNDLPIQEFIRADVVVSTVEFQERNFGLALFVTAESTAGIDQGERIRRYTSISEVADDWNSTDEVYKMAQTAFSQRPKPSEILIGVRFTTNQAGFLECEPLASGVDVDTFKAVTDGSFRITIDGGTPADISGLDFSTAVTLADVASTITTALTGATCAYESVTDRFVFTSSALGDTSSIGFLEPTGSGTDISDDAYLNGDSSSSSRLVQGLTVGTITDELQNILNTNDEAYFIAFTKEVRDSSDVEDIAQFVEALDTKHQFFTTSNDANVLNPSVFTDIASILQGYDLNQTWVQYSGFVNEYPEVSVLARAATINFDGFNTVLTLKYKALPGISPETGAGIGAPAFKSAQLNTVNSKNCNVYGSINGVGKIVSNAQMTSGTYQDDIHFADWLKNSIEVRIANIVIGNTTKVPYTELGVDLIQQGLVGALEQGINNGGLSPVQLATGEVVEAYTISRVPVRDVNPADKQARIYKGLSFVGALSGAIHNVKPIAGTLSVDPTIF